MSFNKGLYSLTSDCFTFNVCRSFPAVNFVLADRNRNRNFSFLFIVTPSQVADLT